MAQEVSLTRTRTRRNRFGRGVASCGFLLLFPVFCVLPSVFSAQNANQAPTPTPSPTSSPAVTPSATPTPSPSPTPTPPLTLHQWGAVTLFHGLPSNSVRAIAQDADGVMWFGTDGGLAKYDGRRT